MKKAYYLLFYKIYLFWKSIYDDGLSDWKASLIINGSQALLLFELIIWWTVFTKNGISFSKYWFILPVVIIVVSNYYIFLHEQRWEKYEEEFNNHSKKKKIITSWLTFVFFVFILASIVFAFYQMSLIDWSKYR